MRSPIARGFFAIGRLFEWGHRKIHGPEYAPGDVVDTVYGRATVIRQHSMGDGCWYIDGSPREGQLLVDESEIIRVVRYGEGE